MSEPAFSAHKLDHLALHRISWDLNIQVISEYFLRSPKEDKFAEMAVTPPFLLGLLPSV